MKWVLWILGSLVTLVAAVAAFGAWLPVAHTASRRARYHQPPQAIWDLVTGPPSWRPQVAKYEPLPERDGKRMWRETSARGEAITFAAEEADPPRRYVTRIADQSLPFGGRWVFELTAAGEGTELRITEEGEIYNILFRALAKLVFGYTSSLEDYLKALGAKLGEAVTPEP